MSQSREQWVNMYPFVDAHLEHCRAAGFAADTTIPARRAILERIVRAFGDLHQVTSDQLASWLSNDTWMPWTRATHFGHIRGYYQWAKRQGHVADDPTDRLVRPHVPEQRPHTITDHAFTIVMTEAVEPWLTAAILAGYAGLRCAEIARAVRQDIDRENIHVRGKGGRVDEIPTSPVIWSHVRGRRPGALVRPALSTAYAPKTLSWMFVRYCREELGVDVALHCLRRYYGNMLRRQGVDLEVIRQLMRHQSLATTQRYLNVREEERRAAIQTLPAPTGPLLKAA